MPIYEKIRALRRKHRVYLIFGHFIQIQYSMLFKTVYFPKVKLNQPVQRDYTPEQNMILEQVSLINLLQFFNQLYILLMVVITLGLYVVITGCSIDGISS